MEDLLRNAYCFPGEDAAMEYIESTDDYSWNNLVEPVRKMIEDPAECVMNPKTRLVFTRTENDSTIDITHHEP